MLISKRSDSLAIQSSAEATSDNLRSYLLQSSVIASTSERESCF